MWYYDCSCGWEFEPWLVLNSFYFHVVLFLLSYGEPRNLR